MPGEKPQELWRAEQTDTFLLFLTVLAFFFLGRKQHRGYRHTGATTSRDESSLPCVGDLLVYFGG